MGSNTVDLDAVGASTQAPGPAVAPSEQSYRTSKFKKFVKWYFSCLCPDPHQAVSNDGAHSMGDSAGGGSSSAPAHRLPSQNPGWLMRFLLAENWTDGSLIALKTDIFAGVTLAVAQVAPSVAFAMIGHGQPLVGLYSSFFLGIICCVFGGRPGQITAIAGAVVVLYPSLVDKHGYGAACAVSVIAGCFLLLPGIFRFARLVRLLPSSLMLGFCNGLGLSMVVNQIPQFKRPDGNYVTGMQALYTAIICVVTYAVMMLMPYFTTIVPSAFVAIIIGTAIEYIFQLGTVTIGDLYTLHGNFPKPMIPDMAWTDTDAIKDVMVASILTAIVSAVESFMSGYKIQQLTETPTNFERESLALGAAHIVNGFFQGMSGCVVFGPCILNIECGAGTRRVSSFICAVFMVVIPLALYMVIGVVPMGALSAVLFGVSSKTADWRMLAMIFLQRISLQESVVAIVVTVVTVVSDLAIGAASGLAAALVFFMWNMARGRVRLMPMEHQGISQSSCQRTTAAAGATATNGATAAAGAAGGAGLAAKAASSSTSASGPSQPRRRGSGAGDDSPADREEATANGGATADASEECFTGAMGDREERYDDSTATGAASRPPPLEVLTTVIVRTEAPTPVLNHSLIGSPHELRVNFLDVFRDETFPEVKVLRIKLHGVLFFGSCMEFVDGMLKMLHEHHGEIFLKVTDFILDFQHGLMPVLDFSAAEAIQDTAHILAKRGIRTHVQNMDPLSWACFDRIRRYFPDVCEDDVNNAKQFCYVRRVFKIVPHHEMCDRGSGVDALDDDVFLRGNRSFMRSTTTAEAAAAAAAEEGDADEKEAADSSPAVTTAAVAAACAAAVGPREGAAAAATGTEPTAAAAADGEEASRLSDARVVVPLSATEECLPFSESVKVGFAVYRPELGIVVPVFDTISRWAERTKTDIAAGRTPALELGLTSTAPIDRQFGDVGKLWWKRLLNLDIPAWVRDGAPTPRVPDATTRRSPEVPLRRLAPQQFEQVARFPGQGFAKGERLRPREWADIKACVCQQIFSTTPPPQPNRFLARMRKAEKDLVDGFI